MAYPIGTQKKSTDMRLIPEQRKDNELRKLKKKMICFSDIVHSQGSSDFDGTIFLQDSGHVLFDAYGCGPSRRAILEAQINSGERSFRDVSEEMWASVNVPFENGFVSIKSSLEMDPDFRSFHQFCLSQDIPFRVISAGLKPILRKLLDAFLGELESATIDIVANEAIIPDEGMGWKPLWRHSTVLGHDKALSIQEARNNAKLECEDDTIPLIIFIGDGVSDLPAAREADVLFARRNLRLEEYCIEHNISYIPYDTFADIQREVEILIGENEKKTESREFSACFNQTADIWQNPNNKFCVPTFLASTSNCEEKIFLRPNEFSECTARTLNEGSIAA
ncbi:Pdp3-interacting factor 1 [Golovinomyces cichoracearum]|uniref:Pdp3-interacting factor 1 n=1 Tax=Golovinomyces cichoracearum TaxID=62708 RepID=A0A420J6B0_9PEZI|nr:Pdp3-interacting factor 1 [Golovinomyces cichoracearum]